MSQSVIYKKSAGSPEIDYADLAKQVMQPWANAYESWRSGVSDLLEKQKPKNGCDCEKCRASRCGPDSCTCRCCVDDADLILEARVGERRVISLEIENTWRRPRDIELELSSWTATPQGAVVTGAVIGPAAFTLDPCSEKLIVLEVTVGETGQTGGVDQRVRHTIGAHRRGHPPAGVRPLQDRLRLRMLLTWRGAMKPASP
jgi:hypothetical protein